MEALKAGGVGTVTLTREREADRTARFMGAWRDRALVDAQMEILREATTHDVNMV